MGYARLIASKSGRRSDLNQMAEEITRRICASASFPHGYFPLRLRIYPETCSAEDRHHPDTGKQYFVESRLLPLAEELGYGTIEKLVADIRAKPYDSKLLERLVEASPSTRRVSFGTSIRSSASKSCLPSLLKSREPILKCSTFGAPQVPADKSPTQLRCYYVKTSRSLRLAGTLYRNRYFERDSGKSPGRSLPA